MIDYNLGEKAIAEVFAATVKQSMTNQVKLFQEFRAFYENDYEEIKEYVKESIKDTYSEKTRKILRIQHRDGIQKMLGRKTSGIFDQMPIRRLKTSDDKYWEELPDFLAEWNWNNKIRESLKRAIFFNTILAQPVWRKGTISIDINTGDQTIVNPDHEDYNLPKEIYLNRTDFATGNLYVVYWSAEDHYIIEGHFSDSVNQVTGNIIREWNGEQLANNYTELERPPFEVLRINEGMDFWGEPNHHMLQGQREYDIDLTNFKRTLEYQSFGVWVATNLGLGEEEVFSPQKIIRVDGMKADDISPDLKNIVPSVQFDAIRESIDWQRKSDYESQGLSSSSSDTETKLISGVAKGYDESEIQEQRELYKRILIPFEVGLFEIARVVYNKESGKKIPEGEFTVEYPDEKPFESATDKKVRLELEKTYGISDEVDIVMQEKDMEEDEAIEHIKTRKERQSEISMNIKKPNLFDRLNDSSRKDIKPV